MIVVSALIALTVSVAASDMDVTQPSGEVAANTELTSHDTYEAKWLHSFDDAKKLAMERKVPLLVHFEAEWCGACRTMDTSVMNEPSVLKHLGTTLVAVRIDADQDPALITQFGISSLPTEIIIGDDGKELARYVGGTTLSEYTARLERAGTRGAAKSETDTAATELVDENLRPCLLLKRDGKVVGFGGFSPVAMQKDKQWLKGNEEFVGTYLGVDYFFQSAEERELFYAGPEQYIPRLHGFDLVELQRERVAAAGAIELGAYYKGRLFFFLSEENRQRFQSNPAWYADGLLMNDIKNVDDYPFLKSMTLN